VENLFKLKCTSFGEENPECFSLLSMKKALHLPQEFTIFTSFSLTKECFMKYFCVLMLCAGIISLPLSAQKKVVFKNQKDSVSYVIGMNIGKDMKTRSISVNPDLMLKGLRDGLNDAKSMIDEAAVQRVMMAFQQEMTEKQREVNNKIGEKNKKDGEAFLAMNKNRDSVVTQPSGLQYKVLRQGTGKTPTAKDTVVVHYRGSLLDGKEFDNSYKRGEPISFPVTGVIKGWIEALQLMKEGDKWEVYIPSELGYGERGAGQMIGPNSVLIFEVELISVK
jgi:FKBP-type peptidyl-prolyl cis-trans isomerase FklB